MKNGDVRGRKKNDKGDTEEKDNAVLTLEKKREDTRNKRKGRNSIRQTKETKERKKKMTKLQERTKRHEDRRQN